MDLQRKNKTPTSNIKEHLQYNAGKTEGQDIQYSLGNSTEIEKDVISVWSFQAISNLALKGGGKIGRWYK